MRRGAVLGAVGLLLLGMLLGGTVLHAGISNASSAARSVLISNKPTQPVPVAGRVSVIRSPQDYAPYEKTIFFNQDVACTEFACDIRFPSVPAGKRLVVTYASAQYGLRTAGGSAWVTLGVNGNKIKDPQILLPTPSLVTGTAVVATSTPVTFYADEGDVPTLTLSGQVSVTPDYSGRAAIVGYLVGT